MFLRGVQAWELPRAGDKAVVFAFPENVYYAIARAKATPRAIEDAPGGKKRGGDQLWHGPGNPGSACCAAGMATTIRRLTADSPNRSGKPSAARN